MKELAELSSAGIDNRRLFLKAAAGLVLSGMAPATSLLGASERAGPQGGLIDVHAHMVPDFYRDIGLAAGMNRPDGMPGWPTWSPDLMLETMDRLGIGSAVLSVSSPGIHFGDDTATAVLARRMNEFGAELKSRWPRRVGYFASLPLPDVATTLKEIEFSLDSLKADGVVLMSNSEGNYPGDPKLEPVLAELDRREAIVLVHPTSPTCPCTGEGQLWQQMGAPAVEFMMETTRMVTNLILSGATDRYRKIRFIIPHTGGTLPAIVDRLATTMGLFSGKPIGPEKTYEALSRFYFDLAGPAAPRTLPLLRTFASGDRILYGSDWPFTPEGPLQQLRSGLDKTLGGETDFMRAAYRLNALKLFPQFAQA